MARKKKSVEETTVKTILRNYDIFSLENRVHTMDKKIKRSYDIYSIEKRIHDLEKNGGGGELNLITLNATPTTSAQTINPESPYNGFDKVNISAVTSSIDENIVAGNIKKDVEILGVTGTYEGSGTSATQFITREYTDSMTGNATISKTGKYILWTDLTSAYLNTYNFTINGESANTLISAGLKSTQDPTSQGFGYAYYEFDLTVGDVFAWSCTYDNRCFIMFNE